MALRVYSTLTREKLDFEKVTGKKPNSSDPADTVTMYVCGPTVYKPSHIGHMVGPVIFDTVKRYLTYLGYKVKWVVNITDVDDKLIQRAKESGTTVPELAAKMTEDYFACLKALNVTGIDVFPRATQHIGGMIDVINALIKKDYAYEVDDGVYFDVSKDADYGKLSNRDPEQMEAGARLEPNAKKRNPGDFALWKSKPGEPAEVQFDSPFKCGRGRPGWHIECTCMASAELGETLDIHGGGLDLQFPHHENELAQSESWTGKPFARVWMHNGLLKLKSGKMAGSLGNVLNVADALKAVGGDVLRFFILNTHYRSPIDLGDWEPKPGSIPSNLETAQTTLQSFYRFFERYERITKESYFNLPVSQLLGSSKNEWPASQYAGPRPMPIEYTMISPELPGFEETDGYGSGYGGGYGFGLPADFVLIESAHALRRKFVAIMGDDFNTGAAVAVLFQFLNELNKYADQKSLDQPGANPSLVAGFKTATQVFKEISGVLGLFWAPPAKKELGGGNELVGGLMALLLDLRNNLRASAKEAAKDNPLKKALFDQTDLIRKRLGELGVTLEDRPGGTTWRVG